MVLALIVDNIHDEIDDERQTRAKLEDRVRELEIKTSQQDVAIAKRDVTIARQDVAIAELQSRLATGDRKGGVINLPNPSMKTIN
jgi:hypothetical protein